MLRARPGLFGRTALWLDIVLAIALAILGAAVSWNVSEYITPMRAGDNQWFQADLTTVWLSLTDRYADHRRANVHPLFPLVHTTSVYALRGVFDIGRSIAVAIWVSTWAAAWIAVCYAVARSLRFARRDALLIAIVMLASASALCWISVPDTRTVGSVSMLACVLVAVAAERRPVPDWLVTTAVAASLSMTITNGIAGLALLVVTRPIKRAAQLAVNAFVVVVVLQVVQGLMYPTVRSITQLGSEQRFLFYPASGTLLNKLAVMGLHSVVMPGVQTPIEVETRTPMLSVQLASPDLSSVAGVVALGVWVVALAWGVRGWYRCASGSAALKVIALTAVGQVALHLVYGEETFLYTLHLMPLLVLIAACVMKSARPLWGRALFAALALALIVHNATQIVGVRETLDRISVLGQRERSLPLDEPR